MGGATSRFAETDWAKADGGLDPTTDCIDGARPTSAHMIITLSKHTIVNQREFDVRDDQAILLYNTKAVEGTVTWFDVLGAGGQKLLRVEADMQRRHWDVFAFATPAFPGQQPDSDATAKAGEPLYKKARLDITWDSYHATLSLYGKDERPEGGVDTSGTVVGEPILKVEEIKSITAQFQTHLPHKNDFLVGFWVWEHTVKTHRIKMHLAKNSDMALHIALAVMTNMVHTQRKGRTVV